MTDMSDSEKRKVWPSDSHEINAVHRIDDPEIHLHDLYQGGTFGWIDDQGAHVTTSSSGPYICPDLLRLSQLGEADGWRGRAVRGFFRLLRWVTGL